ncbi:MAG: glycosyltransferase family 39 protein [Anaerolineae bacterium]|nr:glycosyltransferase family 39 protein [Anaerolineae bacterium]
MSLSASSTRRKWLLLLILGLYLLLTIGYGILNPLFESPDEHWHFFTAQYLADNWELPAVTEDYDEWLSQEAAQPPLYYLLSALLIAPVDAENGRSATTPNPFATIGDASYQTNINRFIHTTAEAWPWQDFALAAHILRWFSTLLGLGTLLCIYGSSRLVWPTQPDIALLAAAFVAFLPQFAFLHSSITNDTLIIFLASFALWQILRVWLTGGSNGRFLLLGITIGLAILTKTAGILLLVYTGGIVFLIWVKNFNTKRQRDEGTKKNLQSLIFNLLWLLLPALLIGGWLWLRNWQLYGDITATEPFIRIAGGDRGYTLWQVLREYDGLWASLFAIFGWFNLRPPDWVFWVWNGIVVVAIGGLIKNKEQRLKIAARPNLQSLIFNLNQPWFIAVLLAVWVLGVYAGLMTFMMKTEAAQGRLLFPAILPLALALAYGVSRFRWRWVYITTTGLALATSVYCLFFVVAPAYAVPPMLDRLPETAVPLNQSLSHTLTLVGAEINTETAVPGDYLTLTLYWQSTQPPAEPSEFVVELIGREGERVANLHSLHGRGLYPDTLWPSGEIVADEFSLLIDETAVAPVLAPLFVGLAGDKARIRIGEVKIAPETWPKPANPPLAQLGDNILLTQAQVDATSAKPGDTITITVQWQAQNAQNANFTTLIHLAEAGQPPLATADNQPLSGQYPTRVWETGTVITDQYTLRIPDDVENGRYPIWLGMYNSETIERLPLTINGERQPHDVVVVGYLEIQD